MIAFIQVLVFFIVFILVVYFILNQKSKAIKLLWTKAKELQPKILDEVKNITCFTFSSGKRNVDFRFNRADLVMMDDAFFIFGFGKLGKMKLYKSLVILTMKKEYYKENFYSAKIPETFNFNPNSFNGDVFIEFGNSNSFYNNVEIRLEKLTEEQKRNIHIK